MINEPGLRPDGFEVPAILSEQTVLFPHLEVVATLRDERSQSALRESLNGNHMIAFIPHISGQDVLAGAIGTLVHVKGLQTAPGGGQQAVLKGLWRIRVKKVEEAPTYTKVVFDRVDEPSGSINESPSVEKVHQELHEFAKLIPGIPQEILARLRHAETPGELADLCGYSPGFTLDERIDLLRTLNQEDRLRKVAGLFDRELQALKRLTKVIPISECEKCIGFADAAFESASSKGAEIATAFLNHVIQEHTEELLEILVERYGPVFMKKRSLR